MTSVLGIIFFGFYKHMGVDILEINSIQLKNIRKFQIMKFLK